MKRTLRNLLVILFVVMGAARAQSKADEAAVRHIPQAFAAAAIAIYIYIWNFNSRYLERAVHKLRVGRIQSDSSWLLQHTPVYLL